MMTAAALTALVRAAEGEGIAFISDAIYHGLDYAFPAQTALNISADAVVINSFSKYFCLTGCPFGRMGVPESLIRQLEPLQHTLPISVPPPPPVPPPAPFSRPH